MISSLSLVITVTFQLAQAFEDLQSNLKLMDVLMLVDLCLDSNLPEFKTWNCISFCLVLNFQDAI